MAAPLHIYDAYNRWVVNPIYQDANGKGDGLAAFSSAQQAEAGNFGASGASGASGSDSQGKLYDYLDKATDKAFGYQKQTYGLTNEYRTKEGATQGQIDDRAFQRLSAELESRKYIQGAELQGRKDIQVKGQELTNWQRDQDQKRAITSFKLR